MGVTAGRDRHPFYLVHVPHRGRDRAVAGILRPIPRAAWHRPLRARLRGPPGEPAIREAAIAGGRVNRAKEGRPSGLPPMAAKVQEGDICFGDQRRSTRPGRIAGGAAPNGSPSAARSTRPRGATGVS